MKKVIAVMSSKGGVGKTATSANLALALSTIYKKKILVVDTNLTTASLGLHFNILYPEVTLYDVLRQRGELDKAIHKINENLDLIPSAIRFQRKDISLDVIKEQVEGLSNEYNIIFSHLANKYDLVILDTAPGFNAESVSIMEVTDGILVVSNPDYPTLVATSNLIKYAKILDVPTGGLVLNKVMKKDFEISNAEIEDALKIKILQTVPFDNSVPESIRNLEPVVKYKEHSKAAVAYKQLAGIIAGKPYKKSFADFLFGLF